MNRTTVHTLFMILMMVCVCVIVYINDRNTVFGYIMEISSFITFLISTYLINEELNPEKGMLYKEVKKK